MVAVLHLKGLIALAGTKVKVGESFSSKLENWYLLLAQNTSFMGMVRLDCVQLFLILVASEVITAGSDWRGNSESHAHSSDLYDHQQTHYLIKQCSVIYALQH